MAGAGGVSTTSNVLVRLLAYEAVVQVPEAWAPTVTARLATPAEQPVPVRAAWPYRLEVAAGGGWSVVEGEDRVGRADDIDRAVELLERRLVARTLDYAARAGWVVVAGRLGDEGGRRTLVLGSADAADARTLLREGEALALPLPLPWPGQLTPRGRLTDVEVVGPSPGPMSTAAALSALVEAVVAVPPGGRRAVIRQATSALRGVRATTIA